MGTRSAGALLLLTLTAGCKSEAPPAKATPTPAAAVAKPAPAGFEPLVAHSGGAVKGLDYTNSREALDASWAAGLRWFELDLAATSDGKIVLVNNWGDGFEKLFPGSQRGRRTHAEFLALKMAQGLTPLDFAGLVTWLEAHPEAVVVTDVKDDNVAVLKQIAESHKALLPRLVAQVYQLEEYDAIRALGYGRVILSTYSMDASDAEILEWVKSRPLHAVAMTAERAKTSDLAQRLGEGGLPVYAHTVNDKTELDSLVAAGVDGVYTDTLTPKDLATAN